MYKLRKGKKLIRKSGGSYEIETIEKASNNRVTGEVETDKRTLSTDFVFRQLDFKFMRLIDKPTHPSKTEVGTVVLTSRRLGKVEKGLIGVCYETYVIGEEKGASFIFEDRFYDGFSEEEQRLALKEIGFSKEISMYEFSNVMQLEKDYINGIFDDVLKRKKFIAFFE